MVIPRSLRDFQGLWEERETALCFPRFPSGRHFHRLQFLARIAENVTLQELRLVSQQEAFVVSYEFSVRD